MLTATRTEAIAEAEKVLLVDALEDPQYRLLDDLVLQRGDAQWPLAAVGLGPQSLENWHTRREGNAR